MNKYRIRKKLTNFIVHACLTILSLVWIFPLFWVIMTSFRAGKGSYSSTFLPDKLTIHNYVSLFTDTDVFNFPQWFLNTLIVAIFSCILSTFFIVCCSHSPSRIISKKFYFFIHYFFILSSQ